MTASEQSIGLDDRIVSSVRECWDAHQMPLLLSRLGSQDNSGIAGRTKEQAGSLRAYLHQRLADRVRVIQHSDKPQLVGAVPADFAAGTTSEVDALLERTHNQRKESTQRFQPAFWAAFRKPLDEDKRRYVSVQKPVHFRDLHLRVSRLRLEASLSTSSSKRCRSSHGCLWTHPNVTRCHMRRIFMKRLPSS